MDYSAYSVLSSEQKERIRAFVGFCNARDHLYNEIYLGSEFKAYPEMKVFYLAQEGSEIVGFLMVYADDRESAEISACVLSSRRREGIFSALFQQAGMELKKYHYSKVLLKTEKAFEDQQAFLSHYPVSFSHSEFLMVFDASGCRPCAPKEGFSLRLAWEATSGSGFHFLQGFSESAGGFRNVYQADVCRKEYAFVCRSFSGKACWLCLRGTVRKRQLPVWSVY